MLPSREDRLALLETRARLARLHEGREVLLASDPAAQRHRRELVGTPVLGATEEPGHVLVEWIGQPSPRDSPMLAALRARGLLLPRERAILERASLMRIARVDGLTSRSLSRDRDGFSQDYCWGPVTGSYVQSIAHPDIDRLFGHESLASEFRILDPRLGPQGPAHRPDAHWLRLINALRAQNGHPPVTAEHAALRVRAGIEMGLVRVDAMSRTGMWLAR